MSFQAIIEEYIAVVQDVQSIRYFSRKHHLIVSILDEY